jgi:hypothetical protein
MEPAIGLRCAYEDEHDSNQVNAVVAGLSILSQRFGQSQLCNPTTGSTSSPLMIQSCMRNANDQVYGSRQLRRRK